MTQPKFEIETPRGRRRAKFHMDWADHAVLRTHWTNFDKVADGVYRSNHPNHARLKAFADMGGKTVLSLRGAPTMPPQLFEAESCAALGLTLVMVPMSARKAPRREALLTLLDTFETIERPFLMHCKSGADRTGLAAALYLMVHEGRSVADVKAQLSFRYIHIRRSKTGILDYFLRVYAEQTATEPMPIRAWIATRYDRDAFIAAFEAYQSSLKPWEGWR